MPFPALFISFGLTVLIPRLVLILMFFGPLFCREGLVTLLAYYLDLPEILLVDGFIFNAGDIPL